MSELNVPFSSLATTEGIDLSHRGTPLKPEKPEHYTNKAYVDEHVGRSPSITTVTCDGVATTYTVTHNLNTTNIASIQIFDTTGGTKNPIGLSWEPTTANTIILKPDVLLPVDMILLVIVTA